MQNVESNDSVTSTVLRCQFPSTLSWHVARTNQLVDPNQILFAQPLDNWRGPQGGYTSPGFEMFATICPHLAWSCQKPRRQLRTELSGRCWRSVALHTYNGARWCCIVAVVLCQQVSATLCVFAPGDHVRGGRTSWEDVRCQRNDVPVRPRLPRLRGSVHCWCWHLWQHQPLCEPLRGFCTFLCWYLLNYCTSVSLCLTDLFSLGTVV